MPNEDLGTLIRVEWQYTLPEVYQVAEYQEGRFSGIGKLLRRRTNNNNWDRPGSESGYTKLFSKSFDPDIKWSYISKNEMMAFL